MEAGGAVGGVMVFNMAGWQDGGIETIHIMGPEVYDVYDVYDITHILMGFHGIPMTLVFKSLLLNMDQL